MQAGIITAVLALSGADISNVNDVSTACMTTGRDKLVVTDGAPAIGIHDDAADTVLSAGNSASPREGGRSAIAREFDYARSVGTAEALKKFIARNPDHPLAEKARQLVVSTLLGQDRNFPVPQDRQERATHSSYDTAVSTGTVDALDRFIAEHPGHALAANAQWLRDDLVRQTRRDADTVGKTGLPDSR